MGRSFPIHLFGNRPSAAIAFPCVIQVCIAAVIDAVLLAFLCVICIGATACKVIKQEHARDPVILYVVDHADTYRTSSLMKPTPHEKLQAEPPRDRPTTAKAARVSNNRSGVTISKL